MSLSLNMLHGLPQKLRRITASGAYRPEIDGLRFIAITIVFLWHFIERVSRAIGDDPQNLTLSKKLPGYVPDGYSGAAIFFSISAFILFTQLKKKSGSLQPKFLKNYFQRRLLRIEPPYIFILVSTYLIICLTGYEPKYTLNYANNSAPLTESLFASIFYLHNIIFHSLPRLFIPGWYLEVEVQFYILAPVFFTLYTLIPTHRARLIANAFILVLSGVLAFALGAYSSNGRFWFFTLTSQFEFFWIGVTIFELLSANWFNAFWKRKNTADYIAFLGLIGIIAISTSSLVPPSFTFKLVTFPFFIIAMFTGAVHGKTFRAICSNRWICLIGGACYSIYLTHLQIMTLATEFLFRYMPTTNVALQVLIAAIVLAPLALIMGLIFYSLIERPLMAARKSKTR